MYSIEDLKRQKRKLEEDLLEKIQEFEGKFGVNISELKLISSQKFHGYTSQTIAVVTEVKV